MSFEVSADAYGRFMGRFSEPLAKDFLRTAGVEAGQRALDVGCGAGALTAALVATLGSAAVSAVDPSETLVASVRQRLPQVDARVARAELLPFDAGVFDVAFAQLVVHFMSDPVAGLVEMARVTRPGGLVAASVWDHAGGAGPLAVFWRAVLELDADATDESSLPGVGEGQLAELFHQSGLADIRATTLSVVVRFADFEDWWRPFTFGVGPAGAYVAELGPKQRAALRARCAELLPRGDAFEVTASAWTALGRVAY